MGVAIVDLLPGSPGVREVVRQWITCGLATPVAWTRPQESPTWNLLARLDELETEQPDESLGVLNLLGPRTELGVVVLASSLLSNAENEAVPAGDRAEEQAARELLTSADVVRLVQSIFDDIDRNFGPAEIPFVLVVVPPAPDKPERTAGDGLRSALRRAIPWRDVFVIAPEDSPDPNLGNEASTISAPAIAHALLSVAPAWAPSSPRLWNRHVSEVEAGLQGARLVRGWTRVVDAGFLIDHVTRGLGNEREPEAPRIDAALGQLLAEPAIGDDLALPVQPQAPAQLTGWQYVIRYLCFALWRLPLTLVRLVVDRILAPVHRFVHWLLARLLLLLGAPPQRSPADLSRPVPEAAPTPVDRARAAMGALDRGEEVDDPPSPNGALWRELTSRVIEFVDRGELSIQGAAGPTEDGAARHLLARLSDMYRSQGVALRAAAEQQIEIITGAGGDDPAQPAVGLEEMQRPRPRRRFIIGMLMVLMVVSFALGLFVIGLVSLGAMAGLVLIAGLVALILEAFAVLAHRFRDEVADAGGLTRDVAWLETLIAALIARTYRVDQIAAWNRILRATLHESGAGSALDCSEQTLFRPGAAPRSMTIATGILDDGWVQRLVSHVRRSEQGRTFHQAMWQRLMVDRPKAYEHTSRSLGHGELAQLLLIETEGVPDSVRGLGRTIVQQALLQLPPGELVKEVVRWERRADERGIEILEPPPGIEALGPTGRIAAPTALHLGTESFSMCVESLHSPTGEIVGLATKIGESDAVLLTASALPDGHLGAALSDGAELSFERLPLGLSRLRGRQGSGLQLAGLGQLRPGRVVIVGRIESGEVTARRATIGSLAGDGAFQLDVSAALGSPVIDSDTGTVIGVVVSVGPTTALGPQSLQPLLLVGGAASVDSFDDELDTGLQIPRDVLALGIGGQPERTIAAPDVVASWSTLSLTEFVEPILAPAADFHPLLFREGRLDDVKLDIAPPTPADTPAGSEFIFDDKRVLLKFRRIQVSGQVPFITFDFFRSAEDSVDDDDHEPDVSAIIGRGLE